MVAAAQGVDLTDGAEVLAVNLNLLERARRKLATCVKRTELEAFVQPYLMDSGCTLVSGTYWLVASHLMNVDRGTS